MNIATDELLGDLRREDPDHWHFVEHLLHCMPRYVARADATGEIADDFWSEVPPELQNRINVPVAYGGAPLTATAVRRVIVFERIGRICPALPIGLPGPGLSMPPVLALGTEEQKRDFFQRFAGPRRPVWGAFAMTEPQGGSDATAVRTVATRVGDRYILNGEKCFITNGRRADVVVVFATIDPSKGRFGIRAFVVPKGTSGFELGRGEDMMGLRASQLASLSFSSCELPAQAMLGHTGKRGPLIDAFAGAQGAWDYMRPVLASLINGSCFGILEHAEQLLDSEDEALTRAQRSTAREVLSQFRARTSAAQLLALRAAWRFDLGKPASLEASTAKAYSSTMAGELANELATLFPLQAAQVGRPIEKFYRDAKAFDILEGTGDMQRLMIARSFAA